jgi:hypothetical protein
MRTGKINIDRNETKNNTQKNETPFNYAYNTDKSIKQVMRPVFRDKLLTHTLGIYGVNKWFY